MASRVIIVGAGEAARMLAGEITARPDGEWELIGFLDDDTALEGQMVSGAPVMGRCDDLPDAVAAHRVDQVIIAVPSAGREFIRRVVGLCRDATVPFKIVPGLLEIIRGPVHLEQLRDATPEDLLGRDSVEFDEETISRALAGRTVLVTGAGGSIGGEICRQIGRFPLASLILLGRGENQIYEIEHELQALFPKLATTSVIVDIRDARALERVLLLHTPDYVYHAAAHKHVHYMEAFPEEAVKNNVLGTRNVIEASRRARVKRVVMLSTDKAVSPGGVMGATKRVAEYLMKSAANDGGDTRFITVRFGNVLASRGSVVPLFVRQIQRGGPVTVSDNEATRFFMSLREACMLVVQASIMGEGGEVFVLRMGEPIRIVEIARDLIALLGFRVGKDIEIRVTGLRPGEKLTEDLVAPGEQTQPSAHSFILKSEGMLPAEFSSIESVAELGRLADAGDGDGIRRYLDALIPDASLVDADNTAARRNP
ncbi:MAG: polysaccharide biosynthesis protein [Candidatus Krumholzibacteriota bacterium]|nr:polysaccharide biosynthesis protein [Candidatus Krumholzibacteriota bacterium]